MPRTTYEYAIEKDGKPIALFVYAGDRETAIDALRDAHDDCKFTKRNLRKAVDHIGCMFDEQNSVISLSELAEQLRLPKTWLRSQADAGRIPYLRIGRRYRFNLAAVNKILADLAASGDKKGE